MNLKQVINKLRHQEIIIITINGLPAKGAFPYAEERSNINWTLSSNRNN